MTPSATTESTHVLKLICYQLVVLLHITVGLVFFLQNGILLPTPVQCNCTYLTVDTENQKKYERLLV